MLLRQPPGLYVLFLTEMWERFSFYGLRALIVLYMVQVFIHSDAKAYSIYGAYTALVYATPVIGGYIADRWLGARNAVVLGGVLIALGHFSLAMPGHQLFYIGLGFIICGTGFFKSNVSSMVGYLYGPQDPRRDSGFTLFYMGINLGAFIAAIACGLVADKFGWHYGFGLAGVGMVLGLLTFWWGQRHLENCGAPPNAARLKRKILPGISLRTLTWIVSFLAVPLFSVLLFHHVFVGHFLTVLMLVSVAGMLLIAFRSEREQRDRVLCLLVLMLFAVFFFASFEQAGSSMTLFAERSVDRYLGDWLVPTPVFQSLNPLFIIVLGPVFAALWIFLGSRKREPATPFKFFLGLLFVALGFGALALGGLQAVHGKANMVWLILAYLLHTVGELCLSPVGLSAVTRLAPTGWVSMMMGVWFLASAFSNHLAAMVAKLTSVGGAVNEAAMKYTEVFSHIFYVGMAIALVALMLSPLLKRMMHMDTAGVVKRR